MNCYTRTKYSCSRRNTFKTWNCVNRLFFVSHIHNLKTRSKLHSLTTITNNKTAITLKNILEGVDVISQIQKAAHLNNSFTTTAPEEPGCSLEINCLGYRHLPDNVTKQIFWGTWCHLIAQLWHLESTLLEQLLTFPNAFEAHCYINTNSAFCLSFILLAK